MKCILIIMVQRLTYQDGMLKYGKDVMAKMLWPVLSVVPANAKDDLRRSTYGWHICHKSNCTYLEGRKNTVADHPAPSLTHLAHIRYM